MTVPKSIELGRRIINLHGAVIRLFLLVLPLAILWRPLTGEVFRYQDLSAFYFPREAYLSSHGVTGWDSHILLGVSLLGDPQTAPYEPIRAASRAMHLDPRHGFLLFLTFYFAVAIAGARALARRWGCNPVAAATSALVLVGGGIFVVRVRHPWVLPTMSVVPWVLLLSHDMLRRPRVRTALTMGAVLAAGALGGHPQASYLAWLFVVGYLVVGTRVASEAGARVSAALALAWRMALGVLAFGGLLAGYYGPVISQLRHSPRHAEAGLAFAGSYSWNPWDWLRVIIPDLYGNDMAGSHFGTRNYHEQTFYLGVAPLMLVVLAFLWRSEHRRERLLVYMGTLAFVLAAGQWLPPFYVGYFVVPGWRLFRAPCRWLWFLAPCATTLVGLVLTRMTREDRPEDADATARRMRAVCISLLAVCLGALATALIWTNIDGATEPGARRAMLWGASRAFVLVLAVGMLLNAWLRGRIDGLSTVSLLIALTVVDLGLQWLPYRQSKPSAEVYPPPRIVAALASAPGRVLVQAYRHGDEPVIVPLLNWGEVAGYDDVRGYSQAIDQDVRALLRAGDRDGRLDRQPAELAAIDPADWLLDLTGVTRIAAPAGSLPAHLRQLPVVAAEAGWEVRSRPGAFPAAWLVRSTRTLAAPEALKALPTLDLRQTATVDEDLALPAQAAAGNAGTATVTSTAPDQLDVEVRANAPCLLVVGDRIDPGWSATLDGVATRVVRADFLFRGVSLGGGVHHVHFSYRTPGKQTGMVISGMTVIALLLAATVAWKKARPRHLLAVQLSGR